MKAMQIYVTIVLLLLSALAGGCGKDIETRPPWEMPDSMLVKPEPHANDTILKPIAPFLGIWEYCALGDDTTVTAHGSLQMSPNLWWFDYAMQETFLLNLEYRLNGIWFERSYNNKVDTVFIHSDYPLELDTIYAIATMTFTRRIPSSSENVSAYLDFPGEGSVGCYFIDGRMYLLEDGGYMPREPRIYRRIE
jgi:hypothetical protein